MESANMGFTRIVVNLILRPGSLSRDAGYAAHKTFGSQEVETDNQIYGESFLVEGMVPVPKDSHKLLPVQDFIGLQVIDSKGSLVGTVKDISLDLASKYLSLRIATKDKGEIDIGWDDVQSVEDVVLLKKLVDSSSTTLPTEPSPFGGQAVQAMLICPSCGATSAAHAKFCSKCGASLKS